MQSKKEIRLAKQAAAREAKVQLAEVISAVDYAAVLAANPGATINDTASQIAARVSPTLAEVVAPVESVVAELPCPFTPVAPTAKSKEAKPLRKPQVRILRALASGDRLSRKAIAHRADVDYAYCTSHIGATRDGCKCPDSQYPSLKTLGFVATSLGANGIEYAITPTGKAFVDSLAQPAVVVPSNVAPVVATPEGTPAVV